MDLSIIIVSWNVKDLLRECLTSILENRGDLQLEIFVVDNASSDGSVEMVKQEFGDKVVLVANSENLGFSKANNQAIKRSRGRYVLLLNPDMRVLPNTLPDMVKFMDDHKEAGVAGCHLIDINNKTVPHVRKFPTILDQGSIVLKLPHIFSTILDKYLMKDFNYNGVEPVAVDSIRGSFFMIRREVIEKIGGLDERYFIWFEEVDYCHSVIKAGWKVIYNPLAKCIDHVGQSFKKRDSYWKQKQFTKSMLQYFQKWEPWYKWMWIAVARAIILPLAYLREKL